MWRHMIEDDIHRATLPLAAKKENKIMVMMEYNVTSRETLMCVPFLADTNNDVLHLISPICQK